MFPCWKQQKSAIKVQGLTLWIRAPSSDLKRSWNTASGLARNMRMLKALLCDILSVLTHAIRYPYNIECYWVYRWLSTLENPFRLYWNVAVWHVNTRDFLSQVDSSQFYSKVKSIATVRVCGECMIYFTWTGFERKKKNTDELLTTSPVKTYYVQNHSTGYVFLTCASHSHPVRGVFFFVYSITHF